MKLIAALCAVLFCSNLVLYTTMAVPSARRLHSCELKYAELNKERSDAVLFERQRQELAGVLSGVPGQKDMPLLVKELVQSARRLNLSVSAIRYDIPRQSGEDLSMISFSFPVEGRYANIKRFIYDVETSGRPVGIQGLKLDDAKGSIVTTMKLMTYIKGKRTDSK